MKNDIENPKTAEQETREEQVRQILSGMTKQERIDQLKEFDEMERQPEKKNETMAQIQSALNDMKKLFVDLELHDWDQFRLDLDNFFQVTKYLWKLIDSYDRLRKHESIKILIRQIIEVGFMFDEIKVDGVKFCVRDGEIYYPESDDVLPF